MDDDLFVNPADNILIGEADGVFVSGDQDLLSESETIVGPPGPPGPPGRDGRDGSDGQSATVTVGSTTTTAPGTNANVTNVGDNLNAVLNFSIPRGAIGETGPAGADGVDGVDGSDGFSPIASVEQTEYGAEITITDSSGTTTAQVVNGSQGEPGTPGAAATISVGSTTTGAAGTNASVVNSGTSSAAVLDFVIPRGADGTNGTDGTDGTDGFSPIATVTQNTGSATISITDSQGTTTATVYDGTPGTVPNDGTLTIQKNGTTLQTFTANQSSNATANIVVPTQFSDLSGTVGTAQIADDSITPSKLKGYSTANTTNTWVPVSTGDNELQHRVIKAFNADGSIPKTALAGMPCPDYANVITTWGNLSTTVTETTTASGYIVGKCLIIGARQRAYIEINGIPVGGIPYNDTSQVNNLQVAFCIPVANNTEVKFYCSGTGGRFEGCKLVGWKLG